MVKRCEKNNKKLEIKPNAMFLNDINEIFAV